MVPQVHVDRLSQHVGIPHVCVRCVSKVQQKALPVVGEGLAAGGLC